MTMLSYKTKTPKVVFRCPNGMYFASINVCSKNKFLGTFNTKEKAVKAAENALNGKKSRFAVCYY